jgi:hypothetical protein
MTAATTDTNDGESLRRKAMLGFIERKSGGLIGPYMCLLSLSRSVSPEEFELFCKNTPDGEELWLAFTFRRDAPDAPEGYTFIDYAREVLGGIGG